MSENGDWPELPEGWATRPAGEVLDFEYGKGLPARSRVDGEVGVFASAGRVGSHNESLVEESVLVIGRKGAAGNVFIAEGPAWVIDTAYYAEAPAEHDLRFLAYQLQLAELGRLDQSTAIPSLSREDLKRVALVLPPLEEQRRIVARLGALGAMTRRGLVELERATHDLPVLRRAFVEKAIPSSSDLPSSWTLTELSEVADVITGTTPSKAKKEYYGASVPLIKPTQLTGGAISPGDDWLSEKGAEVGRLVEAGAVLTCCIGATIGKVGIAVGRISFNQQINAAVFTEDVLPEFGLLFLSTRRPWLVAHSTATAIPQINKTNFSKMPIPVPPLDEQRRIVSQITEYSERISAVVAAVEEQANHVLQLERVAIARMCTPAKTSPSPLAQAYS